MAVEKVFIHNNTSIIQDEVCATTPSQFCPTIPPLPFLAGTGPSSGTHSNSSRPPPLQDAVSMYVRSKQAYKPNWHSFVPRLKLAHRMIQNLQLTVDNGACLIGTYFFSPPPPSPPPLLPPPLPHQKTTTKTVPKPSARGQLVS